MELAATMRDKESYSERNSKVLASLNRKGRVLVVEDDLSFKPFWRKVLESADLHVELDWATTKEEAELLIRSRYRHDEPYDLVISDIWLDGPGTGIDLWNQFGEAVRHFAFVSGLPITRDQLTRALDFGIPTYLHKPLSGRKCRELLQACVQE